MKMHRLEKIWLVTGFVLLAAFFTTITVSALAFHKEPTGGSLRIDPMNVRQTPPFDEPGLRKTGEGEYTAVVVAFTFGFSPAEIEVPAGSEVRFVMTSQDVVHGFLMPGRPDLNVMLIPGYVSEVTDTFDEPGDYLALCHEYCGAAHHQMALRVKVTE